MEGRVICEPEPATLPPTPPLSISHCYAARSPRVGVASPELLTLSVTHFHFIICPLHPRAAPRAGECEATRCNVVVVIGMISCRSLDRTPIKGHPDDTK